MKSVLYDVIVDLDIPVALEQDDATDPAEVRLFAVVDLGAGKGKDAPGRDDPLLFVDERTVGFFISFC
eukprot:CAMPEP_0119028788 /NCGR_PEP_ID=MMETSP1176-20130426/39537_1 /TAXON_ID=265551 /ORGANISM="Synedropsis recta cf, Strain CCMP1620" /LENGTH=67 /DNA_ID=CAMNT_0006985009 /DNA_START=45 /DNA_END=248 /DNA_ORIENTATION=-